MLSCHAPYTIRQAARKTYRLINHITQLAAIVPPTSITKQ